MYSTGRMTRNIRYGKVVIEEGGQLMGGMQLGAANDPKTILALKTSLLTVV